MSRFEFTYHDGDTFTANATVLRDGTPVLAICITEYDNSGPYVSAVAHLPLARLEEVIAGMRSTARGQTPAAVPAPRAAEQPPWCENANCAGLCPDCAPPPPTLPRRFHLLRHRDVSGVSGTGIVALGVMWPDGTASVRWLGERPSTVTWDRIGDAEAVHGHAGATQFVWDDEPPQCPTALLPIGPGPAEVCVIPAGAHTTHRTASGETWDDQPEEP
ncbi:hypothetical protein [Streptomyces sp. NPDC101132]|uniref:hypothetical protein n=1 Tax=Streptomyces sp. NPDC101132 TaxID=3366110 RepID=UPI0037FD0D63